TGEGPSFGRQHHAHVINRRPQKTRSNSPARQEKWSNVQEYEDTTQASDGASRAKHPGSRRELWPFTRNALPTAQRRQAVNSQGRRSETGPDRRDRCAPERRSPMSLVEAFGCAGKNLIGFSTEYQKPERHSCALELIASICQDLSPRSRSRVSVAV